MRTTLTLDDDVSAELDALRRERGLSLKEAVNGALRHGLRAMSTREAEPTRFVTKTYDMDPPLIPLDNIAEAIAAAEGEDWRWGDRIVSHDAEAFLAD